jgi:hypothetical protein
VGFGVGYHINRSGSVDAGYLGLFDVGAHDNAAKAMAK